jgi:hypothetical protein
VRREIGGWLADGRLQYRETIVDGLERAPEALVRVLSGDTTGNTLVRIAWPPWREPRRPAVAPCSATAGGSGTAQWALVVSGDGAACCSSARPLCALAPRGGRREHRQRHRQDQCDALEEIVDPGIVGVHQLQALDASGPQVDGRERAEHVEPSGEELRRAEQARRQMPAAGTARRRRMARYRCAPPARRRQARTESPIPPAR